MRKLFQLCLKIVIILSITFTYTGIAFSGTETSNTDNTGNTIQDINIQKTPKPTDIDAGAYIMIDLKSGQVLLEKDSNKQMYPASTTKMLTGAIACEIGDMDQMMTASAAAIKDIGKDGMNIGINPGEQLKLGELLKALLISSANETANIIAENLCDTRQEFVDLMNKKARELGCTGTNFKNPCGAHENDHYTTAADLAKIARYAMSFPKFREIASSISYQLEPTNKHTEWPVLYTTNKLLRYPKSGAAYQVTGIKTGFTSQAGNNLVSGAVNSQGLELIAVVMNVTGVSSSDKAVKFSRELLDYGFSNFEEKPLIEKGRKVQSISVTEAADEQPLELVAGNGFKYVAEIGIEDKDLTVKTEVKNNVVAPVIEGDILGYITYEKNGIVLGKVDLLASRTVMKKEPTAFQSVTETVKNNNTVRNIFFIIAGLFAFFIILRFTLKRISARVKRKRYKFQNRY